MCWKAGAGGRQGDSLPPGAGKVAEETSSHRAAVGTGRADRALGI